MQTYTHILQDGYILGEACYWRRYSLLIVVHECYTRPLRETFMTLAVTGKPRWRKTTLVVAALLAVLGGISFALSLGASRSAHADGAGERTITIVARGPQNSTYGLHPGTTMFAGVVSNNDGVGFALLDISSTSVNFPLNASQTLTVSTDAHEVVETFSPTYSIEGYYVVPGDDYSACYPDGHDYDDPLTFAQGFSTSSALIPADANNYVVCIVNRAEAATRTILVQKVTTTEVHPAASFPVNVSPGAPNSAYPPINHDVNFDVAIGANQPTGTLVHATTDFRTD